MLDHKTSVNKKKDAQTEKLLYTNAKNSFILNYTFKLEIMFNYS